ncbi:Diphthine methyl ester synthase [Liparis tanakae]|uniref:diphthine methyl ester synthase n=1 Tax=Liparis tanakae TaxID=230148 RepID=A0A4Z2E8R8_9TELE|nr:Diphthine methyl ester synthase [Liparis tanakae]
MLYLVGLGLGDAEDITVKGLRAVRSCSRVYLEAYTSVLTVGKEALVSPEPGPQAGGRTRGTGDRSLIGSHWHLWLYVEVDRLRTSMHLGSGPACTWAQDQHAPGLRTSMHLGSGPACTWVADGSLPRTHSWRKCLHFVCSFLLL